MTGTTEDVAMQR